MLENFVKENYGKNLGQLSLDETYAALLKLVQEKAGQKAKLPSIYQQNKD